MIKKILLSIMICCFVNAQNISSDYNPYEAANIHLKNQTISRFKNIHFESIGPAIMSGRVVALDVNPSNSNEFYVAYASGGVWHTKDNGISFISLSH